MRPIRKITSLLVLIGVFWVAPAALAASPPRGDYSCTSGPSSSYDGELFILSSSRYRMGTSSRGAGRYSTRGHSMTFRSGVFHRRVKGKWYKTTEGRYEIALTSLKTGFTSEYCNRG